MMELLPNYFNKYSDALAAVKIKYPNWNENGEPVTGDNKVDVDEGYKVKPHQMEEPINITELFIEGVGTIFIHKLTAAPAGIREGEIADAAGGGYSRRR